MTMRSINPATGETLSIFDTWDEVHLSGVLQSCAEIRPQWSATPIQERCDLMRNAARVLRQRRDELATTITREMGKRIADARAEVGKCADVCEYYAEMGPDFLADELIESDASRSLVAYQPMGVVLAVMPWNFPLWQVFRFAAPSLVAGNVGLLKHASNVPQCALAIEDVFREAGFPENVFRSLMIPASMVAGVIGDNRVHAVTLTGSEPAGVSVASQAGKSLKKSVLELGGSDAFIVLEDADLEHTIKQAVSSRFLNTGQSCIAAKRFIVVEKVAEEFVERFRNAVAELKPGDPMDENTRLAPMARHDLRDELHKQVLTSLQAGAVAVIGCAPESHPGAYYQASILDHVKPGISAYDEELFGPVAIVIRAKDEADAIQIANSSRFGLGGSVWTQDSERGERVARQLECGCAFVNGMVKSDPRLPFGGVKASGYGRELSRHGIREFVNAKTIWIR
ncbi:MAG TPA: NAD-dependent succinate-semialdehyde dehydrogenase [Gammaproteobacteria bacterium]|nr:NAD-dependent succinate-semialdehyde dehydrogenase [Gammaproteobacteria bacterium]